MALSSYGDLIASIQSWMLDRVDLASMCGDFIALAEGDMNKHLRTRDQLTTVTLTLDANGQADLPSDYLAVRQAVSSANPRCELELIVPPYETQFSASAGVAQHFTIDGNKITVWPRSTGEVRFSYFAKIPALTESNPTNWLLSSYPNIYLYGSCMHAGIFISDAERTVGMTSMFTSQIEALKDASEVSMYRGAAMRISGPTP
ncbi:hypothetical protein DKP76_11505 [Falsochrobactrum shanghaiense]|uniref:Uncharacterized protein n=1 Tax=Falsochrobactrum shanghaiense TaxID=2201899 RepID=A0A316J6B0_9HYPH|nr:hypothetical protein [Falsochrobactrum shanghaiense]PWL17397.1 hypothetical protein DKP76_11505 [Falsochrobactrum shanghaiense]